MVAQEFRNDDEALRGRAAKVREERRKLKLEGVVGGLESIVVNVEPSNFQACVAEFLSRTGYDLAQCFDEPGRMTCVLELEGSADILLQARKSPGPFRELCDRPKSRHLPDTRLETFVFAVRDLERFVSIQRRRGVEFLTPVPERGESSLFIQTRPSAYTGNSIGFIEWTGRRGEYHTCEAEGLEVAAAKPAEWHLGNVGLLDHAATRVRAEHRDDAIIEFMGLTNYDFKMAIHVEALNSITNVSRLGPEDFAMVFTSGISPFGGQDSGPTEAFIQNYGTRVHHLAFATESIDETVQALREDGQSFLIDLVGSREEGLRQTFTKPQPSSLLVYEYIHRFDGFDGFFTKSNVTSLTMATAGQ